MNKESIDETTQIYYEWICIADIPHEGIFSGLSYWFHQDDPVIETIFKLVVDDNDLPIQKRVRV